MSELLNAVLAYHAAPAYALTSSEVRDANKEAVVYLQIMGAGRNGVPYQVDATGFLVSSTGELITANHIFQDESSHPLDHLVQCLDHRPRRDRGCEPPQCCA